MPRQKPFDKRTATTYALVNRPQNDPLIHDSDAPSQVFTEIGGPSTHKNKKSKIKQRGDLEEEFGLAGLVRDNEGEAAEHGVYFDDSSYDYMQHMRDLGGATEAIWVEATGDSQQKKKEKKKQTLEDALRESSLEDDDLTSEGGISLAGSNVRGKQKVMSYQDQQDIPDEIAGFHPDMDPRLREVLEALDDDAYASDDDDLFGELAGEGGEEVDQYDWQSMLEDDDEGWESDDTTKPVNEYNVDNLDQPLPIPEKTNHETSMMPSMEHVIPESNDDGAWFEQIAKSKTQPLTAALDSMKPAREPAKPFDASSVALSSASQFAQRKKRKGALTSNSGFSMSSSALARTETMSVMDSRFEKFEKEYMEDLEEADEMDENMSLASGMTSKTSASKFSAFGGSQVADGPQDVPANFDSVLDDFLDSSRGFNSKKMTKRGKKGQRNSQSGMSQLDEVRHGLGPARLSAKNKTPLPA